MRATSSQPKVCALNFIESPANAGASHPLRQARQCFQGHAKTRRHGGHTQQVTQLTEPAALLRQTQKPFKRRHQRAAGTCAEVGDVKRDIARVVPTVLAKNCTNGRRHRVDVGHHHHHVAGVQRRAAGRRSQQVQQLVVQHLHFAQRAVRHMKNDGAIRSVGLVCRVLGQRHQVANAVLHLGQQRRIGGILLVVKQVNARQGKTLLCLLQVVKSI